MAYGLQVFDSSGNITVDTLNRHALLILTGTVTLLSGSSVNVYLQDMQYDSSWYVGFLLQNNQTVPCSYVISQNNIIFKMEGWRWGETDIRYYPSYQVYLDYFIYRI